MKVLLVRFSSLGDVVLVTAAVEALAAERPDVEVHVVTKPEFRGVFEGHPSVAQVVDWHPADGVAALARLVRRGGYHRVIDLHDNLRSRLLGLLTPRVPTSRYRKGAWRRRLAVALGRPALLDDTHVVDRYLAALGPLSVSKTRRLPRVEPSSDDRERADGLLRATGWDGDASLVALAPGARWATKAWPESNWLELATLVRDSGSGWPVVVGGAGDEGLGSRVLAGGTGANLAGCTSILGTAAVLAMCDALVTNDSAPLHLSTAVGTRVVALFGPTVTGFGFYPLGDDDVVLEATEKCRPCSLHGDDECPKGHHRCLEVIEVRDVVEALGLEDERAS